MTVDLELALDNDVDVGNCDAGGTSVVIVASLFDDDSVEGWHFR